MRLSYPEKQNKSSRGPIFLYVEPGSTGRSACMRLGLMVDSKSLPVIR